MDHQDYADCAEVNNATEINSSVFEEAYETLAEKSKAYSSKYTEESKNVISPDDKLAFTPLNWGAVNNAITETVEYGRNLINNTGEVLQRTTNEALESLPEPVQNIIQNAIGNTEPAQNRNPDSDARPSQNPIEAIQNNLPDPESLLKNAATVIAPVLRPLEDAAVGTTSAVNSFMTQLKDTLQKSPSTDDTDKQPQVLQTSMGAESLLTAPALLLNPVVAEKAAAAGALLWNTAKVATPYGITALTAGVAINKGLELRGNALDAEASLFQTQENARLIDNFREAGIPNEIIGKIMRGEPVPVSFPKQTDLLSPGVSALSSGLAKVTESTAAAAEKGGDPNRRDERGDSEPQTDNTTNKKDDSNRKPEPDEPKPPVRPSLSDKDNNDEKEKRPPGRGSNNPDDWKYPNGAPKPIWTPPNNTPPWQTPGHPDQKPEAKLPIEVGEPAKPPVLPWNPLQIGDPKNAEVLRPQYPEIGEPAQIAIEALKRFAEVLTPDINRQDRKPADISDPKVIFADPEESGQQRTGDPAVSFPQNPGNRTPFTLNQDKDGDLSNSDQIKKANEQLESLRRAFNQSSLEQTFKTDHQNDEYRNLLESLGSAVMSVEKPTPLDELTFKNIPKAVLGAAEGDKQGSGDKVLEAGKQLYPGATNYTEGRGGFLGLGSPEYTIYGEGGEVLGKVSQADVEEYIKQSANTAESDSLFGPGQNLGEIPLVNGENATLRHEEGAIIATKKDGTDVGELNYTLTEEGIYLKHIESYVRGSYVGGEMLRALQQWSDETGMPITLDARAYSHGGYDQQELESFYESQGFRRNESDPRRFHFP